MIAEISPHAFATFFAWAPWVIGASIYAIFYIAKRHEVAVVPVSGSQTYACAVCGRRGMREQMVAQNHGGAVGWQCASCATSSQATAH
ncbi:MAG: hypothetical protein WB810_09515 [Candidatus Cybelea sp.]